MEEHQKRKDQQIWAARFMSEKLTKLGKQKAKEIDDAPWLAFICSFCLSLVRLAAFTSVLFVQVEARR